MIKWLFSVRVYVRCVLIQTARAPPDVQQQYLSSIQHLLGDGRIHKHHDHGQVCQMCLSPPLTSFSPPIQVWQSWWRWWRKRYRTHWEGECLNCLYIQCVNFIDISQHLDWLFLLFMYYYFVYKRPDSMGHDTPSRLVGFPGMFSIIGTTQTFVISFSVAFSNCNCLWWKADEQTLLCLWFF